MDETVFQNEVFLEEDSDEDDQDFLNINQGFISELFGDDSDEEESFLGFDRDDTQIDSDADDNTTNTPDVQQDRNAPNGWNMNFWKDGDSTMNIPAFSSTEGFVEKPPDDADEYYFFQLFITDELVEFLTEETNRYAQEYFDAVGDSLRDSSDLKKWPDEGISTNKMRAFLALSYYMGVIKKDSIRQYWTLDPIFTTPFPRDVMSRREFFNILAFLHSCNSQDYVPKGQPGYDPRKKLGKFITNLQESFKNTWLPRAHLSIDEGTIGFKGNAHFKVYNPNKPEKYGIKTFKLCDSSNSYRTNVISVEFHYV